MRKQRTTVLSRHSTLIIFSTLLILIICSIIFFVQARITGNATSTCGNGICTSGESCEWNGALNRQMLCDGKQSVIPSKGSCNSCVYTPPSATKTSATCGNNICESGEAGDAGGCGPDADPRCLGPPAHPGTCPTDCPICGNNICEPGETCLTCSSDCGACPLPSNCNAINWDENPLTNHVNFVFVPSNFNGDMATFETNARRIWSTFNTYAPYTNNPSLNAFFITNENGNFCTQPCNGIDRLLCCDTTKAKQLSSTCTNGPRQTLVVHNSIDYGGAGYPSEDVATTTVHPSSAFIVIHETGHSFGNLYDEYGIGTSANPNCDTASCTKWDEMFSKGWGVSCIGGTHSCPNGYCQYCSGGNYYVGEQSIMYALNYQFEEVNERIMCCSYHQESGSYPAYCDKFKTLTPTLDQYCGVSLTKTSTPNGQVYLKTPIKYTFIKKSTGWTLESVTPRFAGYYPKEKTQGDKNGKNKLKFILVNGKTKTFTFSDTTQIEIPGENQNLQGYTTQPRKSITIVLDNTPKSSLKKIELNGANVVK